LQVHNLLGWQGHLETLKQMKARRPDLEVLMLTGHATVAGGIEAMKQGAHDFLQKPVDIDELLEKIRTARKAHLTAVHQKADAEMQDILKRKSW
jgi:FixJ family two-component response regulator